jgi:hypothetical protein
MYFSHSSISLDYPILSSIPCAASCPTHESIEHHILRTLTILPKPHRFQTNTLCLGGIPDLLNFLLDTLLDVLNPTANRGLLLPTAKLPVIQPSSFLDELGGEIGSVTSE